MIQDELKLTSAAYFIEHVKEIDEFTDLELPQIGATVYIKEVFKVIENNTGARKPKRGIFKIIEEYPNGFLCICVGPSAHIAKYNVREFFRKLDFKKGLLEYSIL